jgi:ATP-binding cassette subfamily F protein 3
MITDTGSFQWGYNVRMGYYDQYQRLNDDSTVLEEIWDDSSLNHTQVRSLLATFLFKGDDVFKEIRVLSGGERARLVLAKLMQKKVNLLLLDEPTNHLDIESREALEEALLQFDGTVIAVSHDRYFVNKLANRILSFQGKGSVFCFEGAYRDYLNYRKTKDDIAKSDSAPSSSSSVNQWEEQKRKKQEERKRQNRILKIETEIAKAEERIREIEEEAQTVSTDYVALQALYSEKEELESRCDSLLEEWSVLEEKS